MNSQSSFRRIAALVPSITDSVIGLDGGNLLIAVSDYCPLPDGLSGHVERVGGPKSLEVNKIISLEPDLVLANCEENDRQQIETLVQAGLRVEVEFPLTPRQVLESLRRLAVWCGAPGHPALSELEDLLERCETAASKLPPFTYFCPIWAGQGKQPDWWMTFNRGTYPEALLALFGGRNVFSQRERRYPLGANIGLYAAEDPAGRDTRYPVVGIDDLAMLRVDCVLLPDEPMNFHLDVPKQRLLNRLKETAAIQPRIIPVDGALLFWPGLKMAQALERLPEILFL